MDVESLLPDKTQSNDKGHCARAPGKPGRFRVEEAGSPQVYAGQSVFACNLGSDFGGQVEESGQTQLAVEMVEGIRFLDDETPSVRGGVEAA